MIDQTDPLPVVRQCSRLDLSRSTIYYTLSPVSGSALALMRRIDKSHLRHPFAGARMPRDFLRQEGLNIGRRHHWLLVNRFGREYDHEDVRTH